MPKTSRFGNLVGDVLVFSGPSSPQGERLPRSDFFLLNLSFLYGLPNRPVFDTRVLISRQWPQSAPYLWLQTPRAPWRAKVEGPRLTIALPAPRHAPVRARGLPMRCCEHLRRRRTPSRFASGTVPRARARGFRRRRPSVRPRSGGRSARRTGGALTGELIWALALALACRTTRPREEPSTRSSRRRW